MSDGEEFGVPKQRSSVPVMQDDQAAVEMKKLDARAIELRRELAKLQADAKEKEAERTRKFELEKARGRGTRSAGLTPFKFFLRPPDEHEGSGGDTAREAQLKIALERRILSLERECELERELQRVQLEIARERRNLLERELERERQRARQPPREEGVVASRGEATPRGEITAHGPAVSCIAKAVGCGSVTPVVVSPRPQGSPLDASAELAVNAGSGRALELRCEKVPSVVCEVVAAPSTEQTAQVTEPAQQQGSTERVEAVGAAVCSGGDRHPRRSDACEGDGEVVVCAQDATGGLPHTEQSKSAVPPEGKPRERQRFGSAGNETRSGPTRHAGSVVHQAHERRVTCSVRRRSRQKSKLPEIEQPIARDGLREPAVLGDCSQRLLGEIPRRGQSRKSFLRGHLASSPAQGEHPATGRGSIWMAWGYFGQIWLFGLRWSPSMS